MVVEQSFNEIGDAAAALADDLESVLRGAIDARGGAILAVSGGRTPAAVFQRLAPRDIDWSRVTVTLTDERWVPEAHPDSNAGLVRRHLLQGNAAAARFVPLYGGEAGPEAGQAACNSRLGELPLPIDATYLGMGDDGHFASLFPGEEAVDARDGICVAVPATAGRSGRMSLTAPTLLGSRSIYLLFNGEAKHRCYRQAKQPGSARELPIRLLFDLPPGKLKVLHAP